MRYLPAFMFDLPNLRSEALADVVDPLSDWLSTLGARCTLTATLGASGEWSARFPPYKPGTLKFSAVVQGSCWLQIGSQPPLQLEAGDCVLLQGGPGHVLSSAAGLAPIEAASVFSRAPHSQSQQAQVARASDSTRLIGGQVGFDHAGADLLLHSLPQVVVMQHASAGAAVMRWVLQCLADELAQSGPGVASVTSHLAQLLFVQVLRGHMASGSGSTEAHGWLGAVADARLGPVLRQLHSKPAASWTLDALAAGANLSRSAFSHRFRTMVGQAPMDYVLHWRMQLAKRELRESDRKVAAVAMDVGYESESAFSHAFKRVVGQPPMRYRRERRQQPRP